MMHEILVFGHWKPVNHLNNEAVLESTLLFFPAPVFNFYAQAFVFYIYILFNQAQEFCVVLHFVHPDSRTPTYTAAQSNMK